MAKKKDTYIFPNILADAMKNVDMKTQLEAAMMSMFLLLIGMILMSVYSFLYLTQGWVFKTLLIFNIFAGILFMGSFLVTTYQQYVSYLSATSVQREIDGLEPPKEKDRINQLLFFGGILVIVLGILLLFTPYLYTGIFLMVIGTICSGSIFFRKPEHKESSGTERYIDDQLDDEDRKILQEVMKGG